MRTRSYALFAGLALPLLCGVATQAGPIVGTEGVLGAVTETTPLSSTSVFHVALSTGTPTDNYITIPAFTSLDTATLDTANLGLFTFGNETFGTFTASTGFEVSSTPTVRTFYVSGSFTPGSLLSAYDTNTASLLITLNQVSPGSISWAATMNTPSIAAPGVPEPASMSLTGIGLSLVGLFHRLRKRSGK
jgi:hypothetical protein